MATFAKAQKDKPAASRLTPRPTAASAARAARNAMNRNLNMQPSQRVSPSRSRPSLSPINRTKVPAQRAGQKAISKSDTNAGQLEQELPQNAAPLSSETDLYVIDIAKATIEEVPENSENSIGGSNDQEEIESVTTETFEIKNSDENVLEDGASEQNTDSDLATNARSLSQTPLACSRPQTPRDSQSSRPQTPSLRGSRPSTPAHPGSRGPSRPTTPAHPVQRKGSTVSSRPCTPQRGPPLARPKTPLSSIPVPNFPRVQSANNAEVVCAPVKEEEDIKSVYSAKQRQFHLMKKELDMKQQAILEVFDSLRHLNDRLLREGVGSGEGVQCQELVVFNVGDWTADEVSQLCRDAAATTNNETALELLNNLKQIDENTLTELDSKVTKVPSKFADLCLQAFTARQELIDWIKDLLGQVEDDRGEYLERIARYNTQGLELCEALRDLKARAHEAVDTVTQISKCAMQERSTLITVGESLVREVARLRQDLEARSVIVNEMREIRAENETAKELQDAQRQLDEERTARGTTKDKLATTESQLRQARIRVTKMDRQLREAEASIVSLTATVKTLEDQSRQREVQLEARARKLKESLKTGEVTNSQIAQQRDALQTEVKSLKEQIETLTSTHKTTAHDLNKELKDLKASLENKVQDALREMEKNKVLEQSLAECQNALDDMKARHPDSDENNPELPTEREIDLWAELQATKDTLRITEDEVTACKREKVRFLETLTKISETENKVGMQQKLAAELLSKEEIIGKMQIQIRELTKNIKLNEQKVSQYEQYVRDLQAHKRAVANCQEAPNGISYQDLQQEIMNLRMSLLDAVHRNDELSEVLAQKEQQLEQQDKTSRAQARIIKVREELINMLKNKETEQSRELAALQQDLEHRMKIVDEVNKQIAAKAEEIQELFTTLENKQQQIHRLEKIVLALEEQQRRAQAQRTRHEEKIAALEHELAAGNRRERKFLFF